METRLAGSPQSLWAIILGLFHSIPLPFATTKKARSFPPSFSISHQLKPRVAINRYFPALSIGYFEQEMSGDGSNTCIEEIWQEFPGYSQYEVRSALAKCGLTTKHIESLVKVLSGGEQAKVRLCKLINRETNVLLLDRVRGIR